MSNNPTPKPAQTFTMEPRSEGITDRPKPRGSYLMKDSTRMQERRRDRARRRKLKRPRPNPTLEGIKEGLHQFVDYWTQEAYPNPRQQRAKPKTSSSGSGS